MAPPPATTTKKKPPPASPSTFPSISLLVLLTAIGLKVLSMSLFRYTGTHIDRSLPSHFTTDGPSLLGIDRVERVRITYKDTPLQMTVLVKDPANVELPETKVVMFLHGFPDDAATWCGQVKAFSNAGFKVVVPVLPGYEPSTALLPQEAYNLGAIAHMLEQIIDWSLTENDTHTHTHLALVGHDWGAVISHILARSGSTSAGKISSLVTIAVPHNINSGILQYKRQFYNSWYMLFIQLPFLPETWFTSRGSFFGLHKLWRDWSPGYTPPPVIFQSLTHTFTEPGVLPSAMQYYRTNVPPMLKSMAKRQLRLWLSYLKQNVDKEEEEETHTHTQKAQQTDFVIAVPTLAISGKQDGCIDTILYDLTIGSEEDGLQTSHPLFPAGVQVRKVEGGGHFVHQEKPQEVNKMVLEWVGKFK